MSYLRKIIAWITIFAIIIFMFCVPAFASSGFQYEQATIPFWDWFVRLGGDFNLIGSFLGDISGSICPRSDDGYHHSNTVKKDSVNDGYICICSYCGQTFSAFESDLQQAYDNYTAGLPAVVYNSDGSISWKLVPSIGWSYTSGQTFKFTADYAFVSGNASTHAYFMLGEDFIAPVDGLYKASVVESSYLSSIAHIGTHNFGKILIEGQTVAYAGLASDPSSNQNFVVDISCNGSSSYSYYWYGYLVVTCTPMFFSSDTYDTITRPTSITGSNYGIIGDDGQLTIVTVNDTIVNEINNTYYNPATGKTETINSWSYDYTDRSYNLTLESGDTITVTYGDQNITIVEGGDTYIIYYVIGDGCTGDHDHDNPTNSDSPGDLDDPSGGDTHEHIWLETDRDEPTCTIPGRIEYICENCGQARVDVLAALGHQWQVKQFVPTEYDEGGNLVQQGYTIYECSVCGEQYKDMTGAGPPGSLDTVDDGGLIGFFNNLIKSLSDNLSGAIDLILSFFRRIPELFGGFLDFLSAMFPFLPEDIVYVLTFGMAAVVFVGIIKAIRR